MGGNLFKLGRLPRADYLVIEAALRRYLDVTFGGLYRIPRYFGCKEDFGDVDILLSQAAVKGDWAAFKRRIIADLAVERHVYTGAVLSTVYRNFQVDFFVVPEEQLLASYHFMSFNDLGNLVGRIFRGFGLKYGMSGLSYVFRRDNGPYKRDILVSRDWEKILAFLKLDHAAWQAGFDQLEEMFEWLLDCPYFRSAPYLDSNSPLNKRAAQRPTIRAFLDYLTANSISRDYAHLAGREAHVKAIDEHFGVELAAAIASERREEQLALQLADKLNGRVVMAETGLSGKALGALMKRLRHEVPRERWLAMTSEMVRATIREMHHESD